MMTTTLYNSTTVMISQIPPQSLSDPYSVTSVSYCVHEGLQHRPRIKALSEVWLISFNFGVVVFFPR